MQEPSFPLGIQRGEKGVLRRAGRASAELRVLSRPQAVTGCEDCLAALLDHDAFVLCRDFKGRTPIHFASACGHLEILRTLLQAALSTDPLDSVVDYSGYSPMHWASYSGRSRAGLREERREAGRAGLSPAPAAWGAVGPAVSSAGGGTPATGGDVSVFRVALKSFGRRCRIRSLLRCSSFAAREETKPLPLCWGTGWFGHVAPVQPLGPVALGLWPEPEPPAPSRSVVARTAGRALMLFHPSLLPGHEDCLELLLEHNPFAYLEGNPFTPLHCAV